MLRRASALALALAGCSTPAAPPSIAETAAAAVSAAPPAPAGAPRPAGCAERAGVTLFTSPRAARAGTPLRVLAVTEGAGEEGALAVEEPSGAVLASSGERHGGPPFWWYAEVPSPSAGPLQVRLAGACHEIAVAADPAPPDRRACGAVWASPAAWDRAHEALYSAWIEKLFDAPLSEQPAWPALHDVLRDPARNLLHDHLGEGEDDAGPHVFPINPDCADLPYFLRAYFAYKLGLPFGYSSCTRGGGGQPPRCLRWHSNLEPYPPRSTPAATFVDFLRIKLADTVHTGTGRVPADGDEGDYYPVPLSFESLRPGTVYTDPYGHVLVVAKRVPQTESAGGVLLAVDGQPDGTVSRRRFWRGNFLFALDPALGSPGFKRFRPVVVDARGGARPLGNAEIAASPAYGDVSQEQYEAGVEGFYDRMDDVLSPAPRAPELAMDEALDALAEQAKGRVLSVANAEKHFAAGGDRIEMPEGAAIFETAGPWEDFSTPSRDLRLLIAVDVVRGFPDRVARRPDRFAMPEGRGVAEVKEALEARLGEELARRTFTYERSDGSSFTLSLADVLARAEALEMAYDPNDCAELRWGAEPESAEAATCRRRAPGSQRARMRRYRGWFHDRRRPPRG